MDCVVTMSTKKVCYIVIFFYFNKREFRKVLLKNLRCMKDVLLHLQWRGQSLLLQSGFFISSREVTVYGVIYLKILCNCLKYVKILDLILAAKWEYWEKCSSWFPFIKWLSVNSYWYSYWLTGCYKYMDIGLFWFYWPKF